MGPENDLSVRTAQKDVDTTSLFSTSNEFVLAYKKTEKLASAVYMVSGLFNDSEPMKWSLRKKVAELLSFILSYKDTPEGSRGDFIYWTKTKATELISLLEISLRGGLVSQMNFSILKGEFLNLINILNTKDSGSNISSAESIPKNFFDVSGSYSTLARNTLNEERIYNTPDSIETTHKMSFSGLKDKEISSPKESEKKTNRQNIILSLLRKKKELTINDIAVVIRDCSEKTIQRELNAFISSGVLKRAGVRRWSRYSLVQ